MIDEIMPIIFVNIFVVNAIWQLERVKKRRYKSNGKKKNKNKICSSSNLNIDVSNVVMKKIKKKKEETENTV